MSVIFLYRSGPANLYHLTYSTDPDEDPDRDPALFESDLQDGNKKNFSKKLFCLLLFKVIFTSLFKDKKSERSHKTVEIKDPAP
jgi:hypothetical protein